ncbi:MAG: hypothetical protein ACI865_002384 [Flavobacteriaceae bacterium]|jgi:hypothetical protein
MSKKKSNKRPSNPQTLDADLLDDTPVVEATNENKDGAAVLDDLVNSGPFAFSKINTKFLLAGLLINIIGFLFMIGGATDDITQFHADEIFSKMRITVAPILIALGYIVMLYAIMKRPKQKS